MKRGALSQSNYIRMLLAQGAVIPCGKCGKPIDNPKNIMREHLNALEISGDDTVGNQQLWHKYPCSHEKTNGKPHTSYGSDQHAIAKMRRFDRRRAEAGKPKKLTPLQRKAAWAKKIKADRKSATP